VECIRFIRVECECALPAAESTDYRLAAKLGVNEARSEISLIMDATLNEGQKLERPLSCAPLL
jgi:hypothetical protein